MYQDHRRRTHNLKDFFAVEIKILDYSYLKL